MKKHHLPLIIFAIAAALPVLPLSAEQPPPERTFEDGNAAYEKADYSEAIAIYTGLIEAGAGSDALFFNLGNAHYRLGSPGLAVLNYERALLVNPGHQEAARNLQFVRNETAATVLPPDWRGKILAQVPPGLLLLLIAGLCWLSLAAFVVALRSRALRPHASVVLLMALPLTVFCLWLLYSTGGGAWNSNRLIAVVKGAKAFSAPMTTSTEITTPAPGSELLLVARRDVWSHVILPDNRPAWMRSSDVEPIVAADSAR